MAGSSTGFTCENERTARVTAADVVWVGIDAGKASHHAAAVDSSGKRLWSAKVADGQRQIDELVARAAASGAEVRWAVDLVSPAAALLLSSGQDKVGHAVEARPECLRHHLRRPLPGRRNLLTEPPETPLARYSSPVSG